MVPFYLILATAIPSGASRAGVFLLPVPGLTSSREISQLCKVAGPLTCGGREFISGAVGLAISSDGTGGPIPLRVFSELVRMSLGNSRFAGAAIFDEAVCSDLYLPSSSTSSDAPGEDFPSIGTLLALGTQPRPAEEGEQVALDGETKSPDSLARQQPLEILLEEPVPLALFDTPLFPGCRLDFHMFEPRYRVMVKQCIEDGAFFGVAHIMRPASGEEESEDEGMFGSLASVNVRSFQTDGRSYVTTEGLCRFRVVGAVGPVLPQTFGLHSAKVALILDDPVTSDSEREDLESLVDYVAARCRDIVPEFQQPEASSALLDSVDPERPVLASFRIAQTVASHRSISMETKIGWLKMTDTKSRLLDLLAWLETIDGSNK